MRHSEIVAPRSRVCGVMVAAGIAMAALGCSGHAPAQQSGAAAEANPGYVNRVWRVERSTSVEPGMVYVFLADGTLVITSPHGTPLLGRWEPAAEGLTMTEQGISYRVTVLALTPSEFRIRIDNPGDPVEITFAPAETPPAPNGTPSAARR